MTVMILSTMICDAFRKPFSADGSTVSRIRGASTNVLDSSNTVAVAVSGELVRLNDEGRAGLAKVAWHSDGHKIASPHSAVWSKSAHAEAMKDCRA